MAIGSQTLIRSMLNLTLSRRSSVGKCSPCNRKCSPCKRKCIVISSCQLPSFTLLNPSVTLMSSAHRKICLRVIHPESVKLKTASVPFNLKALGGGKGVSVNKVWRSNYAARSRRFQNQHGVSRDGTASCNITSGHGWLRCTNEAL